MRGVILAGGTGSRLHPCTHVTNKHLLPVYDKPMIFHPIETLKTLGVTDILIVTGGNSIGDFMQLLGSGENLGVKFTYKIQDKPMGIAHALLLAEDFSKGDKVVVVLGDNVFDNAKIPTFSAADNDKAVIFMKEVDDPERFGVATVDEVGQVLGIEEKPKQPKSNYAVTGLYVYPPDVYEFIRTLAPSARGELEITDVNNFYIKNGRMCAVKLDGFWSDAGTFPSLMRASNFLWSKAEDARNS
ncbi:MAG: sugar phosphate nucleotidyltransferase [Candidatus Aenigmarchaeota archaeon]|nr:sugar phosphate nucleotidyltransferase [Candidatus Aenigmarchaeota archaeon]